MISDKTKIKNYDTVITEKYFTAYNLLSILARNKLTLYNKQLTYTYIKRSTQKKLMGIPYGIQVKFFSPTKRLFQRKEFPKSKILTEY